MATTHDRVLNLGLQLAVIQHTFPAAIGNVERSELVCTVPLQPTPASRTYTMRLSHRHMKRPQVEVIEPPLQLHPGADHLPHIYPGDQPAWAYPLAVTRPPPPTGDEIAELLAREEQLLDWLRGAFILDNFEHLARHLRRYTVPLELFGESGVIGLDLATGRREYQEVEELLNGLYDAILVRAPDYAAVRKDPAGTVETIVEALGADSRLH